MNMNYLGYAVMVFSSLLVIAFYLIQQKQIKEKSIQTLTYLKAKDYKVDFTEVSDLKKELYRYLFVLNYAGAGTRAYHISKCFEIMSILYSKEPSFKQDTYIEGLKERLINDKLKRNESFKYRQIHIAE